MDVDRDTTNDWRWYDFKEEFEEEFCRSMKKEDVKACVINCEEVWLHKVLDELLGDTLDLIWRLL